MTTEIAQAYTFDRLPIRPIPTGTNVLIVGPPLDGARRLLFELLADDDGSEGMILVTTDVSGEEAIEDYRACGGEFEPDRMCVVDCSQQNRASEGPIRQVASPEDLTGIGIEFSSLYESLHSRDRSLVRVGLNSVSTLLVYADDFRTVYRFLHTFTSRIRTADGLGVAAIDPEAAEETALGTITQAFDAQIEVRNGAEGIELRIRGLPDQPEGWQSLSVA